MEGTMKVAVMTGKKKMEWREREIPQPGPGELQIKLEYVGVCGSDLHFTQRAAWPTGCRRAPWSWAMSRAEW